VHQGHWGQFMASSADHGATLAAVPPAECWVVEPPDPPPGFYDLVGYLLNAGVDVAFGPGDVLPTDLPEGCDGVRCVVVCTEDLHRLRTHLRGFRGLDPDSELPIELDSHGTMFLHENDSTWLALWTETGRLTPKRIENPLIVAADLTVDSPRLRDRLSSRPDAQVHRQLVEALLTTERYEWSDIGFGTLWSLVGASEATGNGEYLRAAERYVRVQLSYAREHPNQSGTILTAALPLLRMTEITGYLAVTLRDSGTYSGVSEFPFDADYLSREGFAQLPRAVNEEGVQNEE